MKKQRFDKLLNWVIVALLCGNCAFVGYHLAGIAQAERAPVEEDICLDHEVD